MEALDLARWQFGITTVYHFIFVPLTIGLSLMVALMQTMAVRSKDELRKDAWTRMTKFFGSMLIINFGIGIATGIVQEFQFGMNWSEYARYVATSSGGPRSPSRASWRSSSSPSSWACGSSAGGVGSPPRRSIC